MTPEEAVETILARARLLGAETVGFLEVPGRVLAESVDSPEDLPPFDRSAMDGYAVRSEDVAGASRDRPAALTVVGLSRAGRPAGVAVASGQAVRIMTGGMTPAGADTVVMQEDTDMGEETVKVLSPCPPNRNICYRGEDVRRGERLLGKGTRLPAAASGLLASAGITEVSVVRRPRVAILSTGDELVDVHDTPATGQIRDSNQYTLHALVREAGGVPTILAAANDDKAALAESIRQGLAHDVIVSTGGVSVGQFDLVAETYAALGVEILFEKIAVKPGKPVVFGHKADKLVFGLPGNPTSTVVAFLEFVRPALLKMGGRKDLFLQRRTAAMSEPLRLRPGRKQFLRAVLTEAEAGPIVRLTGHQGSGNLLGAVAANCFLEIQPDVTGVEAGDAVTVHMLPHA